MTLAIPIPCESEASVWIHESWLGLDNKASGYAKPTGDVSEAERTGRLSTTG